MSSLLQTLYWSANPTFALTDNSGSGATETRAITAAESHDALDTTYEGLTAPGDGLSLDGNADLRASRSLDTASAVGTIDFIRVIIKGRATKTGSGSAVGAVIPRLNGVDRGSSQTLTTSFVAYSQDFTIDPADAAAWTNAKLNAQTFGLSIHADSTDAAFLTSSLVRMSEYSVEVWGTAVQTSTPASTALSALVGAAIAVAGAVSISCTSVDIPTSVGTATPVAGLRVVTPDSVACVATVSPDVTSAVARPAPDSMVPMEAFVDGGNTPVTLRSNTAPFYDQNTGTATSVSTPASWPNSGTRDILVGGFAPAAIAGAGAIGGVKFYAIARIRKDTNVTVSNARVRIAGSYDAPFTSMPPTAGYSPLAAYGTVETAMITTSDGSTPWDWATIYAALLSTRVGMDASAPSPAAIGQFAQLDLAEVWCEVLGPVGNPSPAVEVTQRMGNVLRMQAIITSIGE